MALAKILKGEGNENIIRLRFVAIFSLGEVSR